MSDLKDLAKEYAALVPEWPKPGMRCVDPETGHGYRAIGEGDFFDEQETCNVGWRGDGDEPECDRAIAAGPDLDDAATVGCLFFGLPFPELESNPGWRGGPVYYTVRWDANHSEDSLDCIEAIIRAAIAAATAKVTP